MTRIVVPRLQQDCKQAGDRRFCSKRADHRKNVRASRNISEAGF
jgi:hypothetical protein